MAGNSTKIDEVVDVESVTKQLTDTQAQSKALREEFLLLLKTTNDLNNALGKTTTTKAFKQAATDAEASANRIVSAQDKITKAELRRQQLEEKRKRIVREGTADDLARAQAQRTETAAIQQNTTALAANEAAMRRNNLAEIQGEQAAARYRQARLSAIAATQTETAAIAQNTAATAANTAAQNNGLANIGRSLTRGLGYLRTLAYVLPGIGIAGIFNLLFEGLGKLFTSTQQLSELQKSLNDVYKDSNKSIADQTTQLKYLYVSATDVNNAMDERLQSAKKLQEEYPKTFGLQSQENIINGQASAIYQQLTKDIIANARAKAAANKIAEQEAVILDAEIQKLKIRGAERLQTDKLNKEREGYFKRIIPALIEEGFSVERATAFAQQNFEGGLRKINTTANEAVNEQDKIIARAKNNQKAVEALIGSPTKIGNGINDAVGDKPPKPPKDTSAEDELRALEYQYNEQIALARAKDKENAELEKEYLEQIENYRKEVYQGSLDMANSYYAKQILLTAQAKEADIQALTEQYESGLIQTAEYQQRKKDIEDGYAQASVQDQINLASDLIAVKKEFNKDTSKDEIELAKLQIRLAELVTGKKIEGIEKEKAKRKELNAAIKQLADEAANFIVALVDAGFTNRKNQIEAQKEDLEKQTQQEIDAVDRSLGTEQEKADKIAVIKAKQQSQNESFARQQKKIDVEKAKFDKAVAIARIIENTAIGVTGALARFNVPLAILIGALGAVQLGTVLAQPIPQYAKGTKNHKGGLSIIGEEGAEKVDLPNGKSFISASTAQLINLPAGTKVTPHGETMRMIGKPDDLQRFTGGQAMKWDELIGEVKKLKPTKQRQNINVHVHGSYEAYKAQRLNGRL